MHIAHPKEIEEAADLGEDGFHEEESIPSDMDSMLNAANRVFGPLGGNFDRSASPVDKINEGVYSQ